MKKNLKAKNKKHKDISPINIFNNKYRLYFLFRKSTNSSIIACINMICTKRLSEAQYQTPLTLLPLTNKVP